MGAHLPESPSRQPRRIRAGGRERASPQEQLPTWRILTSCTWRGKWVWSRGRCWSPGNGSPGSWGGCERMAALSHTPPARSSQRDGSLVLVVSWPSGFPGPSARHRRGLLPFILQVLPNASLHVPSPEPGSGPWARHAPFWASWTVGITYAGYFHATVERGLHGPHKELTVRHPGLEPNLMLCLLCTLREVT